LAAVRVQLILLKRDPEYDGSSREGNGTPFEDDLRGTGEEKARARGEKWVQEDPDNRDFSVIHLEPRHHG